MHKNPLTRVAVESLNVPDTEFGSASVDETYREHRDEWERDALGQWVAICGPDFCGPNATVRQALVAGRERFGDSEFAVVCIGEQRRSGDLFFIR